MTRIIRLEVPDTLYQRLVRKKAKDGFTGGGASSWRRWLSTVCGDILLYPTLEKNVSSTGLLQMWMRSFASILPDMCSGEDLRELTGLEAGRRCVVVGRGPTIYRKKHLETLKK